MHLAASLHNQTDKKKAIPAQYPSRYPNAVNSPEVCEDQKGENGKEVKLETVATAEAAAGIPWVHA